MTAHRRPCFPPTWDDGRADGNCKWCNEPLPRNKDGSVSKLRRWHPECIETAGPILMGGQTFARRRLIKRDGRICADCQDPECGNGDLEVDHIVPLWSVDRTRDDAWKFWLLGNLQLLGRACHKAKSAIEAKQRAKEKRLRGETCNGPKAKIQSRPFPKSQRKLASRPLRRSIA